jgi:copper transport protein
MTISNARRQGVGLLCLAAVLLYWLASPASASAHAYLVSSDPPAGALLDTSPQEIDLYFSEAASLQFSGIKLYDRSRTEHPVGAPGRADGNENSLSAALLGPLPAGTYTVVWRVVSATDGHLTEGSFAFRVRAAPTGAGATQTGTPEPEGEIQPISGPGITPGEGGGQTADPFRWAVRGIILAASAFLLGCSLFTVFITAPTCAEDGPTREGLQKLAARRSASLGAWTAWLLTVALIADLVVELAAISGAGLSRVLDHGPDALTLLTSTAYGHAWLLKLASALGLTVVLLLLWRLVKKPDSLLWEVAIGAGSLFLVGESLGSHAAASQLEPVLGLPLPIVSDWLHQIAADAWIGGLGYMVFVLFPAFGAAKLSNDERRSFLAQSTPRFSRMALVSVSVLVATGTYNLALHSTDLATILGTNYGLVLALKHVLLLGLIVLGAINLLRLSPLLGRKAATAPTGNQPAQPGPVRGLRRNVRLEAALAAAVLLCAGGLTLLPPPNDQGRITTVSAQVPAATPTAPLEALPTPGPATAKSNVAGYDFSLTTRPSTEGDELTLTLARGDKAAVPLTDVAKVFFKVTPQDVNAGSVRYPGALVGDLGPDTQVWTTTQQILTLDGVYLVTAIVQRTVGHDLQAAFRLDLSEAAGLQASATQAVDMRLDSLPSPPISGTVTLVITLLDGAGAPLNDATLKVLPIMPAHAHIQPQGEAEPVPGKPGTYKLVASLQMGGSWLFVCEVDRPGQPPMKVDSSLDVIDPNATPTPMSYRILNYELGLPQVRDRWAHETMMLTSS